MNEKLERSFRQWLSGLARKWYCEVEEVAQSVGESEANNRLECYPQVGATLATLPVNLHEFADAARRCWVLWGPFDAIRFNEFAKQGKPALVAIHNLIDGFPKKENQAIERIDHFVEEVTGLSGYLTPRGADNAGAAMLASLILTCLYPNRFVDYRRKRWERFASGFKYEPIPPRATYGLQLIWAGKFAKEITDTNTYQQYWPESDTLWNVAGICWDGLTPEKPKTDPVDFEEISHFPEGTEKRRLHLVRERNRAVVSKAKSLALQRDPMLRCEVCDFSFLETYGELGSEFIEAHHKIPLAKLKPGSKTKVEDLGMVCANCHRLLHRGETMLTIEALRAIVQSHRQGR